VRCGEPKLETAFGKTGRGYLRRVCDTCRKRSERSSPKRRARINSYDREYRKSHPHKAVLWDCRSSDRKKGLVGNDLDEKFILAALSNGCAYCGEQSLRMSLDRIDNTLPHTKSNVIPCCIRCNYLRGSMPYPAWTYLVPTIREAKNLGLFGDWRSEPFNKKKT